MSGGYDYVQWGGMDRLQNIEAAIDGLKKSGSSSSSYSGPAPSGDTSGATDTSALKTAIAAVSGRGTIQLHPGDYYVSFSGVTGSNSAVTLVDDLRLQGAGKYTTRIIAANDGGTNTSKGIIGVPTGAHVEICDLTIQGPSAFTDATVTVYGIQANAVVPAFVGVRNVYIGGCSCIHGPIQNLLCDNVEFDGQNIGNTQTSTSGAMGIQCGSASNPPTGFAWLNNCWFHNLGDTAAFSHSFYLYPQYSWFVNNCRFDAQLAGNCFNPHGATGTYVPPAARPFCVIANSTIAGTDTNYVFNPNQYGVTYMQNVSFDAPMAIEILSPTTGTLVPILIMDQVYFRNSSGVAPSAATFADSATGLTPTPYIVRSSRLYFEQATTKLYDVEVSLAGADVSILDSDFTDNPTNANVGGVSTSATGKLRLRGCRFSGSGVQDAIRSKGIPLKVELCEFTNGGKAINIPTGATAMPVRVIDCEFAQTGAATTFTVAPSSKFGSGNYDGSGVAVTI